MKPNDARNVLIAQEQKRSAWADKVGAAFAGLVDVMHGLDGSVDPGQHQQHRWTSRQMSIAATHIETARLFIDRIVADLE